MEYLSPPHTHKHTQTFDLYFAARPASHYIFSSPQVPIQGDKLILICVVEKFYPKDITLDWFRNGQPIEEVTQFGPFPCESDFYSIWSQTEFILTRDEEGAIYTCRIKHSSFGNVEELSYEINLQGTPPEVLWITPDPPVPVAGEELRLSCRINNFSPSVIRVNWFQDWKPLHVGICHSVSVVGANGLHSMWSLLRVTPAQGAGKTVFTCKVEHDALSGCVERAYILQMPG
nr:tyrosine-protein phosphatase non-receptor type substrate 1-like [Zootoca vivipara]